MDGLLYDTNLSKNTNTLLRIYATNVKNGCGFSRQGTKYMNRNINLLFEVQDLCHLHLN